MRVSQVYIYQVFSVFLSKIVTVKSQSIILNHCFIYMYYYYTGFHKYFFINTKQNRLLWKGFDPEAHQRGHRRKMFIKNILSRKAVSFKVHTVTFTILTIYSELTFDIDDIHVISLCTEFYNCRNVGFLFWLDNVSVLPNDATLHFQSWSKLIRATA